MKKKKRPFPNRRLCWIASALIAICCTAALAIHLGALPSVQKPAADHSTGFSEESVNLTLIEEVRNHMIRTWIDQTVTGWLDGNIRFEDAISTIYEIQQTSNTELANYAAEQISYITVEHNGHTSFELAQKFLGVKNYIQVFTKLNEIDTAYSKYDAVQELYSVCEEHILQAVANPKSAEEFAAFIQLLEDCNGLHASELFTVRKSELSDELVIFLDVTETIDAATVQFDAQNIEESFLLLALGLERHPDNETLATTLVNYRDHYIITITMQAVELCRQESYKKALALVETAIGEYDCTEFRTLLESIKEERSFLYRLKNDIVGAITSVTAGWSEEEFDVKQAASDAGSYIMKSGEKLILGDYSNENVTLLSFTGNVASSLLGADLLFDLRDLSYDVTHWGEDEYFAVWLAADVIALLPVVGAVKYLSHFKPAAEGIDAATELVDSVADVSKNAENAAKLVDTISDVTKAGDDIVDAIDHAKDAMRVGEAAKDITADIAKGYTLIETINQKLLGKVHDVTGVKFELSKIDLSDGKRIQGVFPVFDSLADIKLPDNLYKADFNDQKKECLRQLQEELKFPWSKIRKNFTEDQLDDIADGIMPDGLTWHHNEKEGLMQLVDTLIHTQTGHTGGMAIWGKGY